MLDDDLNPMEPGTGVIGKLARGGNIPVGYYKDPVKTAATFVTAADGNRYAVAGDFARLEADGTITLLGRGSVCINSGGEKIFPEEVEGVLKAHPAVYDTIVVGVPDDRWGQAVCAVVQPRDLEAPPSLASLADHCRSHLAGYKLPLPPGADRRNRALTQWQTRLSVGQCAGKGGTRPRLICGAACGNTWQPQYVERTTCTLSATCATPGWASTRTNAPLARPSAG